LKYNWLQNEGKVDYDISKSPWLHYQVEKIMAEMLIYIVKGVTIYLSITPSNQEFLGANGINLDDYLCMNWVWLCV